MPLLIALFLLCCLKIPPVIIFSHHLNDANKTEAFVANRKDIMFVLPTCLTLLASGRPKLHTIFAFLSAIGLKTADSLAFIDAP